MASNLVFIVLKYILHRSLITFSLRIFFYIFGLHFKQNDMHPGFPIASYSPGLNFKHLMQYRFPQYSHSSILSFSLLKIFSQSSHFQASLTSLPDSEFLLPLRVPLFFSFVIGALEIATFSPVSCFGPPCRSFSLISVIPEKNQVPCNTYHMRAVVLRVRAGVSKAL